MNKQDHVRKFVARALLAAVGGGALLTSAVAQADLPVAAQRQYLATMSVQEYLEWIKKGGPVFCEMIDFNDFAWVEQAAVEVPAVRQIGLVGR